MASKKLTQPTDVYSRSSYHELRSPIIMKMRAVEHAVGLFINDKSGCPLGAVSMGEDAELRATATAASKGVASTALKGTRVAKQDIDREKGKELDLYRAYVLMELPVKAIDAALVGKVKENTDMYTRFRASQGFKELESEIEKH